MFVALMITIVCIIIFGSLLGMNELSFRAGRRAAKRGVSKPDFSTVGGALLGLLGLMLGFSFAGAAGRFIDRQDLVIREANALGTAWLRTEILLEPERTRLRELLKAYADARVELAYGEVSLKTFAVAQKKAADLQGPMWAAGVAAVARVPRSELLMLPALNDVIDLHTTRAAAMRRHLPWPILGLLMVASLLATALLGYSVGFSENRHLLFDAAFVLLVGGVLWIILDLDYPRVGLIQINHRPLAEARAGMTP